MRGRCAFPGHVHITRLFPNAGMQRVGCLVELNFDFDFDFGSDVGMVGIGLVRSGKAFDRRFVSFVGHTRNQRVLERS